VDNLLSAEAKLPLLRCNPLHPNLNESRNIPARITGAVRRRIHPAPEKKSISQLELFQINLLCDLQPAKQPPNRFLIAAVCSLLASD
jgi:hypothetical protein